MWFKPSPKDSNLIAAFKFVSLFFGLFIIGYFALSLTKIPNYVAAITSQFVLSAFFGADSILTYSSSVPVISIHSLNANILDLCSGAIEIAVMFGIIFSSLEKKMRYRIWGFAIGLLTLLSFNAFRIATTIYYFDLGNLEWSAALHDFLFRIFLIIIIVTYYAIWYFYDQPRKKINGTKKGWNK